MTRELYFGVSEQGKAAVHRWEDAEALLAACRWRGAMYLAGYVIECLLKTTLMRKYGCRNLGELEGELQRRGSIAASATVFTHQLEGLLRLTGGLDRLRQQLPARRALLVVNQWLPAWRYTADLSTAGDAAQFLAAVDVLRQWIKNNI